MASATGDNRLVVLQTCLADYGVPFFERLVAALPGTSVLCGREYFTPHVVQGPERVVWRSPLRNRFLLGRSLLWQSGAIGGGGGAGVLIAEFNPRILTTWLVLVLRTIAGKPTLLWGHVWGHRAPASLGRSVRLAMLRLSSGMLCYSQREADELRRALPDYPVWAAPNSCVTESMCQAGPSSGADCVVYVGRLIANKKPQLLVDAFARALDRLPAGARLVLVGDGEQRIELERRVGELGLSSRVEMPGHIASDAALREIYDRAIVAVSPGYVGLSAVQCMAAGVPMIVSRDEPHSPEIEACLEGETCVFFETNSTESLSDAIVACFAQRAAWDSRRPRIASFIRQRYTLEGMVRAFEAAVAAVAAAPSHPRTV